MKNKNKKYYKLKSVFSLNSFFIHNFKISQYFFLNIFIVDNYYASKQGKLFALWRICNTFKAACSKDPYAMVYGSFDSLCRLPACPRDVERFHCMHQRNSGDYLLEAWFLLMNVVFLLIVGSRWYP